LDPLFKEIEIILLASVYTYFCFPGKAIAVVIYYKDSIRTSDIISHASIAGQPDARDRIKRNYCLIVSTGDIEILFIKAFYTAKSNTHHE